MHQLTNVHHHHRRPGRRMSCQKNEQRFKQTLPHLRGYHLKQAFQATPVTLRYLIESCQPTQEPQTTSMKNPISIEKRVAVASTTCVVMPMTGRSPTCSVSGEQLLGMWGSVLTSLRTGATERRRSTVNALFTEFCAAEINIPEDDRVGMFYPDGMAAHMHESHRVTGFPQAGSAQNGYHFPVSFPKGSAADYYSHQGW